MQNCFLSFAQFTQQYVDYDPTIMSDAFLLCITSSTVAVILPTIQFRVSAIATTHR